MTGTVNTVTSTCELTQSKSTINLIRFQIMPYTSHRYLFKSGNFIPNLGFNLLLDWDPCTLPENYKRGLVGELPFR